MVPPHFSAKRLVKVSPFSSKSKVKTANDSPRRDHKCARGYVVDELGFAPEEIKVEGMLTTENLLFSFHMNNTVPIVDTGLISQSCPT